MKFFVLVFNFCWIGTFFLTGQSLEKNFDFSSFDQTKIAFTDEGKGQAVVLIHGFISNGSSWNNTLLKRALLKKGYRVIVPDLRGNGKSEKPKMPEAYADNAEIKDLVALADYLKLDAYFAVGYSRGAIILAKLMTQERRIEKAVLGGMGLDFTIPDWDRRVLFADAFSGRAALTEETSGAVNYAKSIGADVQILGFLQDHQPVTSKEELQKITTKTLVIAGDLDIDNGNPADLHKNLTNSSLQIIPGDHNNTHQGESFSDAVITFFSAK